MPTTTLISRVFMNGNSQAVRIPQVFRLDARRVSITRTEDGGLLLRPLLDSPNERADALLAALQAFDDLGPEGRDELIALLEEDRREQLPDQDRESF